MNNDSALATARDVLSREALFLDLRQWDDWLGLFRADCEYWVPAWKSEGETTVDPDQELSLIYYDSRTGLEERVARIRSGRSAASVPMPRTVHSLGNIVVTGGDARETIDSQAAWTVHLFNPRNNKTGLFFGLYEHRLRFDAGRWLIARKKVILMNDYIPTLIDIYTL